MRDRDKSSAHNKLLLLRTRELDAWDVATLVEWSGDADDGVRDWATFALAARDDDDEEIRKALLDRIDDPDFDTRSEAIWGLARRRDLKALDPLIDALRGEVIGTLFVEAAGYLARPELVEPLEEWTGDWGDEDRLFASALARCRGDEDSDGWRWERVSGNDNA